MVQTPIDVLAIDPSARRLIVIESDGAVADARQSATGPDRAQIASTAVKVGLAASAGLPGLVLASLIAAKTLANMQSSRRTEPILRITRSEAAPLALPPGHPRERTLYVAHPTNPKLYYAAASFHRLAFEHKFAEAMDLLMHLGAKTIRVEHVQGWSRDFAANLTVPLRAVNVDAKADGHTSENAKLLYEAQLDGGHAPVLPSGMVWYPHEPTWQSVAQARMKFGLRDFSLTLIYDEDFGVNASLETQVTGLGLQLGGKFNSHESTVWRFAGTFG